MYMYIYIYVYTYVPKEVFEFAMNLSPQELLAEKMHPKNPKTSCSPAAHMVTLPETETLWNAWSKAVFRAKGCELRMHGLGI